MYMVIPKSAIPNLQSECCGFLFCATASASLKCFFHNHVFAFEKNFKLKVNYSTRSGAFSYLHLFWL